MKHQPATTGHLSRCLTVVLLVLAWCSGLFGQHDHHSKPDKPAKPFTEHEKKDAATAFFFRMAYAPTYESEPVILAHRGYLDQFQMEQPELELIFMYAEQFGLALEQLECQYVGQNEIVWNEAGVEFKQTRCQGIVGDQNWKKYSKARHKLLHQFADPITNPRVLTHIKDEIMTQKIYDQGDYLEN